MEFSVLKLGSFQSLIYADLDEEWPLEADASDADSQSPDEEAPPSTEAGDFIDRAFSWKLQ